MKIGKNDIKAFILFKEDEFALLQNNSFLMAEAFGLDRRIENLSGKRKIGFYRWDLDCLEAVVEEVKVDPDYKNDIDIIDRLAEKIYVAIKFIESYKR